MYNASIVLHSLLRWVILLFSLIVLFRSFSGMRSGKPFSAGDKRAGLILMISAHIQLLIGLYQWLVGPWGLKNIENIGFGAMMKDKVARFYGIEHLVGMLIAIVLITLARRAAKKNIPDRAKHSQVFWLVLIALILILASVPWPFRVGIARPWV
jgi:hypothetical protein